MSRLVLRIAVVTLLASAVGCSPAAKSPAAPKPAPAPVPAPAAEHDHDHDHGDHAHPETLAAGIAELEQAVADVGAKLAEGTDDAADDAVHAIGHLIDDLRGLLAGQEGLADDAKTAGNQALDEIFTAFGTLDDALHSGADDAKAEVRKAHDSVKESIAKAVGTLKERFSGESN